MDLKELKSISRFDGRAKNYDKYRPRYNVEMINFLKKSIGLSKKSVIADIGSGTGILTKEFLDNGNTVYAVEPNEDMRKVAENVLSSYSSFHSIDASSKDTKLESESIDIITAGQSFHWFDIESTKKEFLRILKQNGVVVLLYNNIKNSSNFMNEYLELTAKYGQQYINDKYRNSNMEFFEKNNVYEKVLYNPQIADFERVKGNLASYSYMPKESDSRFAYMLKDLKDIFDKYSKNGQVILEYDMRISYCRMK